jgi:hypothetical protein
LAAWRKEASEQDRPSIFLLVKHARPAEIVGIVEAACRRAIVVVASELPPTGPGEEPLPGAAFTTEVPRGVMIAVLELARFERFLDLVVEGLERSGVTAQISGLPRIEKPFDQHDREQDHIECRLRLRGHDDPNPNIWHADSDAIAQGIDAIIEWCAEPLGETRTYIAAGWQLQFDIDASRLDEFFRVAVARTQGTVSDATVFRLAPDRWRAGVLDQHDGRVTLMEGGTRFRDGAWREALASVLGAMAGAAGWAVYGFARRGNSPASGALANSLFDEAFEYEPFRPKPVMVWHNVHSDAPGAALEHEYAIDAFGVQLLGPGHRGLTAAAHFAGWTLESPLPSGAALLLSDDLDAWFGSREIDETLRAGARAAFAPFMVTEAMIHARIAVAYARRMREAAANE